MASTAHFTVSRVDGVDTASPGAAPWSWEEEEDAGQYFWGLAVDLFISNVTGWPFLVGSSLNHI